ncbi:MAG: hypothetical protein V4468_03575 [Pseudomonadota bacterium]|nr:MAG TPA: hypothetical protein [Caudoviricetes sp.]
MTRGTAASIARRSPPQLPRTRKPLTRRELLHAYKKIKARVLRGGDPFGVFILKHGRGRRVVLLPVTDPHYDRQLRAEGPQRHYISTYDKGADLLHVWESLCAFDREPSA